MIIRICISAALVFIMSIFAPSYSIAQQEDLLVQIQKRGVIKIGNTLTLPPFGMRDQKGNPTGFSVELYPLIEKGLGVKVEIVDMEWAGLIPALLSGRIDVIGAPMLATLERAQKVVFTHAWFFTGTFVNVKADSNITSIEQINQDGKKCCTIEGGAAVSVIKDQFPKCTPVYLESQIDTQQALLTGRVDAVFQDELIGKGWVDQHPGKIVQIDKNLKPVTYSFAVRPDLASYHLKNWFDQFFANIIRSGEYGVIYKKWTGKDFQGSPLFHGRP